MSGLLEVMRKRRVFLVVVSPSRMKWVPDGKVIRVSDNVGGSSASPPPQGLEERAFSRRLLKAGILRC